METSFQFRRTRDGYFEYRDREFFEYTGLPEDVVYGNPEGWMRAVHPDDLERAQAMWALAVMHLDEYRLEVRLRGKDGEVVAWPGAVGGFDCTSGKRAASNDEKRWTASGPAAAGLD